MQITYVSMFDMENASSTRLHNYASEIAKLGHDVTFIVAPGVNRSVEGLKMKYMRELKKKPFRSISLTASVFFSLLNIKKSDIVHFSKPLPILGLPSMMYKKIAPCKIICDWDDIEGVLGFSKFRSFPEKQIISFFEDWILSHVDGITPISRAMEKLAKKYHKKILYLPNLAMINRFGPWISGSEIRKRYGWGNKKILLFASTGRYSDADICIKAMRYVLNEEDAFLVLFRHSKAKQVLERMVIELGLKNKVKIYNLISFEKVPKLFAAADVLLCPMSKDWVNNHYRLPLKVSEYMAAGKPIVTQDVGEIRSLVGNTAYVTKADVENFAKGIVKALRGGNQIGMRARKRAEKEFFIKQIKRLEEFYENFI